ncbi:peptidase M17 [Burkholderia lata]|uniref:M17 family peptidase N-terminal domain-containing protein n=1 Tax=Burkholderia lata (strain ATCC 17760 / DSM 23089 / LMG 22485 / NCIMB 9086 / R18194 / 383) TaxID=482957 RepID=UPI001452DC9E|nr:M17 family peptidase N-terminal domain-containing protein [Burkholderia lata]VWC71043.1 peptidase M17 [Burkholderia lata]
MVLRQIIGSWRDVSFEVAAWDGVGAQVDLSCGCMFTREAAGEGPTGGLRHLDLVLSGALTGLRREGHFPAAPMETLLISRPPAGIEAARVLLVGLGDPASWTIEVTAEAAATAARTAMQQGLQSVAFAPSILDGGLTTAATDGMPQAMVTAVLAAIDAQYRIAELGLAALPSLRHWVFDVGASRFDGAVEHFGNALATARFQRPK